MPALRERASDIPLLAAHFLRHFAEENGKAVASFSDEALERLVRHPWPGNVRELENVVERAVVLAEGAVVEAAHLPPNLSATGGAGAPQIPGATMAEIEKYAILKTLEAQGGSTSRAADVLGISVRKVQYKLLEYGAAPRSQVPVVDPETAPRSSKPS